MNITPDVEQRLLASVGVSRISDVSGFPFPSHDALKVAVATGQAQLGIEYAAARDLVNITKSPSAALLILALSLVMPALAVGSLILAFATRNWWALGGVVSSFLGQMFANPYNPVKGMGKFLVAGAILHVIVVQSVVQGVAWLSFSFAASAIALWILNHLAWQWAHEATLASEALAAHLFKTHNLHIRDNHGNFHDAQRASQP